MANLLLISGGSHPYHETTPVLKAFLEKEGHTVTLTDAAEELSGGPARYDAIVLNTLRQPASGNELPDAKRTALKSLVRGGMGLVSVHISAASCPDWPEMKKITGGGWVLGQSWHPPFGWFEVTISKPKHPVTKGVSDFWTFDECYCGLDIQPGIDVFMHGVVEGEVKPLGWSHKYGKGKVANIALGHAGSSQQHPMFQRLVLNAAEFVTA